ncbi:MAG: sulfatase-like hydrolase/transferase [Lachnospiraceae bacterium]|nr:sulfatase-like hydrolase/transferase [Lachnospiraceae bacterium]
MKALFKFDRDVFKIYIEKTALYYLFSVMLILLVEMLARHSPVKGWQFVWDHPFLILYSALILTTVYSVSFLFARRRFVWLLITVVFLTLGVSNCILLFYRITPLAATDISLITSVFGIMHVYLDLWQIILLLAFLVAAVAAIVVYGFRMKQQERNFPGAVLLIAALFSLTGLLMDVGDETGALQTEFANLPDAYEDNGYVYCFTRSLIDRGIEEPEEYSEETVEDIFAEIKGQGDKEVEDRPNIIFLQIESFFDLSRVTGVEYSEEPMPVYSTLLKSCPSGRLTVPSVGAGTANTEFEVLTGMSLDYFGAGEYPYKTVLQEETCESVAYNLKKLGYRTTAIHNNTGTFYDRNLVYANLGFDCFDCEEYMQGLTYNPLGWAKDSILTQQIVNALKASKQQDFIYTISVQPHGKYPTEKIENPHLTTSGFAPEDEGRANGFEYYVNEVHDTDAFLGLLISTLNAYDEPTVVVMFGDHLPNIDMTEDEISGGSLFETEYLIWSNLAQKEIKTLKNTRKDLYAYQLYSYVFGRLGMNQGVLTKFHQKYSMEQAHEEELETLMYDMLYGDREVYGGINPYEPVEMQMGIAPIRIEKVDVIGGSIYVHGENFTEYSKVMLNDKRQETIYLNQNTLMVADVLPEDLDRIYVAQMAGRSEQLSRTEEIVYTE